MKPSGYQKLSNEEDSTIERPQVQEPEEHSVNNQNEEATPPTGVDSTPVEAPPPYVAGEDQSNIDIPSTEDLSQSPPLYSDIVKLPTYNESENIESDNEDRINLNRIYHRYFETRDSDQQEFSNDNIGTDIGFILCFLAAFVFNGLGFIFAYCSTNTLSSHYGAISGFGLSLVKWAFIVKHKELMQEYFQGNEWLLYCVILLGWMIFMRGILAYGQLKRYVYSRARSLHDQDIVE